jgi:glycosyltransferase involved in cell wall biosynthesis
MEKLVSIVMPVYNGQNFLNYSINSIISQTYKNFELIIVNDNSKDNSEKIINSFCKLDKRIRYFSFKKKIGLIKCLNLGISKSQGYYIARMDVDDFSYPERLKVQVDFLKKNNSIDLVGSQAKYFGNISFFSKLVPSNKDDCKSFIIFKNPFIHSSILIKKKILKFLGNYKNYYTEDYYLWSEFFARFKATNIKKNLLKYRTHKHQHSQISEINKKINLKKKKSIMLIQKIWISKLLKKFSHRDLYVHYEISHVNEKFIKQKKMSKMYIYYDWLKKLKKENQLRKIFNVKSFNTVVDLYATIVCLSFSNYGKFAYKVFKSYSFANNHNLVRPLLIIVCFCKINSFYVRKLLLYVIQIILIK